MSNGMQYATGLSFDFVVIALRESKNIDNCKETTIHKQILHTRKLEGEYISDNSCA
jgi:hypothetical protein